MLLFALVPEMGGSEGLEDISLLHNLLTFEVCQQTSQQDYFPDTYGCNYILSASDILHVYLQHTLFPTDFVVTGVPADQGYNVHKNP